jgi:3-oxoacyl-[acyl-carrier protein] reductase
VSRLELSGRRALVTGAGRRGSIGREIALTLANAGADVGVNDFERDDALAEVAGAIRQLGRRSIALPGDIRSVSTCKKLIQNCGAHYHLQDITEEVWDNALNLMLRGPFFLSQAAAVPMQRAGRGWIVNISSEQAYIGEPELCHYTSAKGGLRTLTKSLALALAPEITVNSVCPGPTATDKFKLGKEFSSGADKVLPRRRWGSPADVAQSVLFLVSPSGDAYTGQTLDPNCGAVMD